MNPAPNWIEVSASILTANFHALQSAAGPATEILAVIKARAYGHGEELCAPILVRAGARWLGVTCAAEGKRIRQALAAESLDAEILIMCGFLPHDVATIRDARLTPVVWTTAQIASLTGTNIPVHVEIDTGMGRQGVVPGAELAGLLDRITEANLRLDGIFTHFCSSEDAASELTQRQERLFEAAVAQVAEAGLKPAWVHAGNSSTVDNPAQDWPWLVDLAATVGARAMVRTGLALYGYCLPISDAQTTPHVQPALQPVLTWNARVLSVRSLAPGETIGYNATFTAREPMRVALLPVGYADGLRRELSSTNDQAGGWVMLHGRRAPILGRISMNLTVVDVSAIPATAPGDVATILGPGITADDHARLAGTIAYEILCGIRPCA